MWPEAARRLSLEDIRGPTPIDAIARVMTADLVKSPVSGRAAAFVRIEVLEATSGAPDDLATLLGAIVVGDVVTLELELNDARPSINLLPRRADLHLITQGPALPIEPAIPELVPLLARAKGSGVLLQRERLVLRGEQLRLRAVVERAGAGERLLVRDDVAPVLLASLAAPP